nr:hypothetical protein Iba_chr10cCG3010 [Ipomoea batatas]
MHTGVSGEDSRGGWIVNQSGVLYLTDVRARADGNNVEGFAGERGVTIFTSKKKYLQGGSTIMAATSDKCHTSSISGSLICARWARESRNISVHYASYKNTSGEMPWGNRVRRNVSASRNSRIRNKNESSPETGQIVQNQPLNVPMGVENTVNPNSYTKKLILMPESVSRAETARKGPGGSAGVLSPCTTSESTGATGPDSRPRQLYSLASNSPSSKEP